LHLKIAVIDDLSPYSHDLINEGLIAQKMDVVFYGPRRLLNGKLYPNCRFVGCRYIWTPNLYPIQIFKQVVVDRPAVVHIQHEINTFGPLYTNLLLPFLLLLLRIGRSKVVVTEHSVFMARDLKAAGLPLPPRLGELMLSVFYRLIGELCDVIIVHDLTFKKLLVEHYGIQEDKISVIQHGVSSDKKLTGNEESDKLASRLHDRRIVLFFGVLSPRKGLEFLLEAFAKVVRQCQECLLVIAGEEPVYCRGYKKRLQSLAGSLGLEGQVLFTGFISNEAVHCLFELSEVVVFPYTFSASASGPLSTALQYHKPIIATKTRYFLHVLEDGEDSLLVSPQNSDELAEAMMRLLEDGSLRTKLSRNAEKKAKKYSWRNVAQMTVDTYEKLLDSKPNTTILFE
jgi:glycosyltransferase involved in cell wall biosynthesis